jgi:hypothetical protein
VVSYDKEMEMTTLPLAVDIADRAAEAASEGEPVNATREAKRLLRDHPEAQHGVDEVAEVLGEEAAAAGAVVKRPEG